MSEPLDPRPVVAHLFRTEYGKVIAILTHKFGPSYLETVEDAVQEALLKAMHVWGYSASIPDNPTAWLLRVANNKIIDSFRKNKRLDRAGDGFRPEVDHTESFEEVHLDGTLHDSQLKMIFACCHPSLSQEYQIILSLKLIGGFSNKELADALLKKEETVAKSFTRAKRRLQEHIISLESPIEIGLQSRLFVVIRVIYLMFSEGYAATSGTTQIKKDICYEAIRLALVLRENRYCQHGNLEALIALMCFHASRFEARLDKNMELVDLEHQDRSLYDQRLIRIGVSHLEKAGTANQLPSNYHLEAAVSYYHCTAKSFEATDWKNILHLYDLQLRRQYSPIVELNRLLPLLKLKGAASAFKELLAYEKSPHFQKTRLYWAVKAEILTAYEKHEEALLALGQAIKLTKNELEKNHLSKKMLRLKALVG